MRKTDGAMLLPYAKSLLKEFEKMQLQIKDMQGFESGLIRIGKELFQVWQLTGYLRLLSNSKRIIRG